MPADGGGIYEIALTHRSFAFEQPREAPHNERLEFLGDAVLGLTVTDLIYRLYPDMTEGRMARLRASVVNTRALAEIARSIGLGEHLRLGRGESASGGSEKESLLADALEAVIGAVYLDRGLGVVSESLAPIFSSMLQRSEEDDVGFDPKTALQEAAVRLHGDFPSYRIASSGPDHDKRFTAHVYIDQQLRGSGMGRSKKEAEQNAAREALEGVRREELLTARVIGSRPSDGGRHVGPS